MTEDKRAQKRSVFAVLPRAAADSVNARFTPALSNTDAGFSQVRCRCAVLFISLCPAATRRGPPCSCGHLASLGFPLPARGIRLLTLNPQPWPWAACLLLEVGLGPFSPWSDKCSSSKLRERKKVRRSRKHLAEDSVGKRKWGVSCQQIASLSQSGHTQTL